MNRKQSVILIVISLFIFSCGGNSSTETGAGAEKTVFEVQGENGFVGKVTDTNAFIALLIANDEAIVYVCNGDEEIDEWFRGTISDPNDMALLI